MPPAETLPAATDAARDCAAEMASAARLADAAADAGQDAQCAFWRVARAANQTAYAAWNTAIDHAGTRRYALDADAAAVWQIAARAWTSGAPDDWQAVADAALKAADTARHAPPPF